MKRDLSHLTGGKAREVADWMASGGGIDNTPCTLHVDNARRDRIEKAFDEWYASGKDQAERTGASPTRSVGIRA